MEIWGHWVDGERVSKRFDLKYSGTPSLFEGKTPFPADARELKLQVLAADQAGNLGQHTVVFQMRP